MTFLSIRSLIVSTLRVLTLRSGLLMVSECFSVGANFAMNLFELLHFEHIPLFFKRVFLSGLHLHVGNLFAHESSLGS